MNVPKVQYDALAHPRSTLDCNFVSRCGSKDQGDFTYREERAFLESVPFSSDVMAEEVLLLEEYNLGISRGARREVEHRKVGLERGYRRDVSDALLDGLPGTSNVDSALPERITVLAYLVHFVRAASGDGLPVDTRRIVAHERSRLGRLGAVREVLADEL